MKLLLTSSGVANESTEQALTGLLGKPIEKCKALFIPTAIYPFKDGPYYAMKSLQSPLAQLGWQSLGILELSALGSISRATWTSTVEETDAILVWGGDPIYLAYWLKKTGFKDLLSNQVYVGVSAGSMATASLFSETYSQPPAHNYMQHSEEISFGEIKRTLAAAQGAGFVDFAIIPHYNNPNHPEACGDNADQWAAKIPGPVYAIDDQTAIKIVDGSVEVISEGQWKLFNS